MSNRFNSTYKIPDDFIPFILSEGDFTSNSVIRCKCADCGAEYEGKVKVVTKRFLSKGKSLCASCSRSIGKKEWDAKNSNEARVAWCNKRSKSNLIQHYRISDDALKQVDPAFVELLYDPNTKVNDKIGFICDIHGGYLQRICDHFGKGAGCPECGKDNVANRILSRVTNRGSLIDHFNITEEQLRDVHPDDLVKLRDINTGTNDKIRFICDYHGEYKQSISNHFGLGAGCPKCSRIKAPSFKDYYNISDDDLMSVVPEDRDKLLTKGISTDTKIGFVCPEHGIYQQTVFSHFALKSGCPSCAHRNNNPEKTAQTKLSNRGSVESYYHSDLSDVYPDDRHLVDRLPVTAKIRFVCPEHGIYHQTLYSHFALKSGCPVCAKRRNDNNPQQISRTKLANRGSIESYYCSDLSEVYPDDRHLIDSLPVAAKVRFVCPEHGIYYQRIQDHFRLDGKASGCPTCAKQIGTYGSRIENKLRDHLISLGLNAYKSVIPTTSLELDIFLPDYNLAIEVNGSYWHSDVHIDSRPHSYQFTGKTYHKLKHDLCRKAGIRLLHFHAWELENKWDICLNKILSTIGLLKRTKVYARKCSIRPLTASERKSFLDLYHIQGDYASNETYGLFYNDQLLQCMGWRRSATNTKESGSWELNRFASHSDFFVIGGFEKLESHFIKLHPECKRIISFAELRLSKGDMYEHYGYHLESISDPDYCVCTSDGKPHHKFNFRKEKFKNNPDYQYQEGLTEFQLEDLNNLYRVWDCGKAKYVKVL